MRCLDQTSIAYDEKFKVEAEVIQNLPNDCSLKLRVWNKSDTEAKEKINDVWSDLIKLIDDLDGTDDK